MSRWSMREGQILRCQNPNCGCEVRVVRSSVEGDANPRCCCGAEMKKRYAPPTLRRVKANPEIFRKP